MNLKPPAWVPPLENGDRLTRDEFERRYHAMPDHVKAELIEGVVYMSFATRLEQHGGPHADLVGWLIFYRAATRGVRVGDNTTVRLDLDNEPQPDALMMIDPGRGGQARIDEEGYVVGGPEWVGEVSASSVSIDLHAKLHAYRRNGVREYVVWRVLDGAVDWFALRGSEFVALAPDAEGVVRSEVFPGLWLDVPALLSGDMARVLDRLRLGTASPEHAAFVARLCS